MRRRLLLAALAVGALTAACARRANQAPEAKPDPWANELQVRFGREPDSATTRWRAVIGEYGPDTVKRWFTIERDRRLWVMDENKYFTPLSEKSDSVFDAPVLPVPVSGEIHFHFDSTKTAASMQVGDVVMQRRRIEPPPGATQMRVTPVRPLDEIRREAMAATPPAESGKFAPTNLVEVTRLDSTILLEVRYATENNFLGSRMYDTARAFMQKPAAIAVARANFYARKLGYGLLIHDAYRPWYVTKIFWDATPDDKKWLVANPQQGSRHNRGIAVDITLYDLETKKPVDMPSTYDESTERAHFAYPGGTSRERYHRELLRVLLEHEGFAVNPLEWWHFDYMNGGRFAIGNVPFDKIVPAP